MNRRKVSVIDPRQAIIRKISENGNMISLLNYSSKKTFEVFFSLLCTSTSKLVNFRMFRSKDLISKHVNYSSYKRKFVKYTSTYR